MTVIPHHVTKIRTIDCNMRYSYHILLLYAFILLVFCFKTSLTFKFPTHRVVTLLHRAVPPTNLEELSNDNIPLHTHKPNSPLHAKILGVKHIASTGDVCEITIDHFHKLRYLEGQSIGIIPPGI